MNITNKLSCFSNNLEITIPFSLIFGISLIFNGILFKYFYKFSLEKKRKRKRLLQIRKAREKKNKKYDCQNIDFKTYIQRVNSSIPEWAYTQYLEESIL